MKRSQSAALPMAYIVLRILVVLNWLYGAAILGLLAYTFIDQPWMLKALKVPQDIDPAPVVVGLRAIAGLGILAVPLNHILLVRLLRIVETVGRGDPFIPANAYRLRAIAWVLLGLQLLSIAIGAIGQRVAATGFPLHLDAGFSISGWMAVLLTFVLARVFAEGALMRDDLDGTV